MMASTGVSSKDLRLEKIINSEKSLFIKTIKEVFSRQDNKPKGLTSEDKNILKAVKSERAEAKKAQFSMAKSLGKALKENLPSIQGAINAAGLDNPVFSFIGSSIKSLMDQRKELKANSSKELEAQNKNGEQLIGLENDTIGLLKEHSNKLDLIGSYLNTLVSGGEAQKFAEIESNRERIRREESLIDAVNGIQITTGTEGLAGKAGKGGFFSEYGDNILQALIGGGGGRALAGIGTAIAGFFTGVLPQLAAVAAAGFLIYKGYSGALEGWGNAAEKLGKDTATTSDKVASGIGGWLGGVWGLIDDMTGFFGFKTEIGPMLDKTSTKVLASTFDFFSDFENNIKQLYTDLTNWFKDKFKSVIDFLNSPAQEGIEKTLNLGRNLKNKASDLYENTVSVVKDTFTGAKSVSMPSGTAANNMAIIRKTLEETGRYDDKQISALLANIQRESNFDPSIVGDSGKAYGIAQWHPARQKDFERVMGKSIKGSTAEEQAKFMDWELQNTESAAGSKLRGAKTAKEAGEIVSKYYERPLYKMKEAKERGDLAEQIYEASKKKQQIFSNAAMSDKLATMGPSNRQLANKERADMMKKTSAENEKAMRGGGIGAVVNAPRSTRVNQTTNNSTSYHLSASPRDSDSSINMMNQAVSY